jgi:hypothetical protein
MISYRFKAKDVFVSNGDFFIVTRVLQDKILAIKRPIDLKGKLRDNWQSAVFQLDDKTDVKSLNQAQKGELPTTSIAQVGSMVMYGEETYMYCGNADVALGAMVFNKPYLLNIDGLIMDIEDNFDGQPLELLLPKNIKTPLESNKNLVVFEVAPPQTAVQIFTKIEPVVQEESAAEKDFIPKAMNAPLNNTFKSNSYPSNNNVPIDLKIGVQYKFFQLGKNFSDALYFSIPTLDYPDYYRWERNTIAFIQDRFNQTLINQPTYVYTLSENEAVYPDWKLKTDSEFPIGTGMSSKKGYNIVLGKIVIPVYESTDGSIKNDFVIIREKTYDTKIACWVFHPEVYQGGNKVFENSPNDKFLTITKFPLAGTKKDRANAIANKPIGSTQFPIKTRAQIKKLNVITLNDIDANNQDAINVDDPYMFIPYTFAKETEERNPDVIFPKGRMRAGNENVLDSLIQPYTWEYSWKLYNVISGAVSSTSNDEIEKQILDYFDYQNLAIIQDKNPALYTKLIELIDKSVDTYVKNLPKKKKIKTSNDAIYYVLCEIEYFNIQVEYTDANGNFKRIDSNYFLNELDSLIGNNDYAIIHNPFIYLKNQVDKIFNTISQNRPKVDRNTYYLLTVDEFVDFKRALQKFETELTALIKQNTIQKLQFSLDINGVAFVSNFSSAKDLSFPKYTYKNYTFEKLTYSYSNRTDISGTSFYGYYDFILSFSNFEDDSLNDEFASTIKNAYLQLIQNISRLEGFFEKWQLLDQLLPIFGYYQLIENTNLGTTYEDVSTDIRFREWLIQALFVEFDDDFVVQMSSFLEYQKDFYVQAINHIKEFSTKGTRFNSSSDFVRSFNLSVKKSSLFYENPDDADNSRKLQEDLYENFPEEFKGKDGFSTTFGTYQTYVSYNPKVVLDRLSNVLNLMKQNTDVKNLLEGKVTAEDLLLKLYGGGSLVQVVEEEDEPEVVVETVDETVNVEEEINWDDIDTDDIDIMLESDTDEDSIEV